MRKMGSMVATLLLAGSAVHASGPVPDNPKIDVSVYTYGGGRTFTAPAGTYTDLGVSASELFMLRSDGSIERRSRDWPETLTNRIANHAYTDIDYVIDGDNSWGLIGNSDSTGRIYINMRLSDGWTNLSAAYPAGITHVGDIAGMAHNSTSTAILDVYARVVTNTGTSAFLHGEFNRASNSMMWDAGWTTAATYAYGLTTRDGYLIDQSNYYTAPFVRVDVNDGYARAIERLSPYTEHAYVYRNDTDRMASDRYDYDGLRFFALDEHRVDSTGERTQVLVYLWGSSVVF